MDNKVLVTAVAVGVIGVLAGLVIAPSGPDMDDVRDLVAREIADTAKTTEDLNARLADLTTSLETQIAGLNDRVGTVDETTQSLGERLGDVGATAQSLADRVSQAAASVDLDGLRAKIEEVEQSLGEAVSQTAREQAENLDTGLNELRAALAAARDAAIAVVPGAQPDAQDQASADAPTAATPPETSAPDVMASHADSHGPGMTTTIGDGALRVFVSRVDADAGTARLSVNGELHTLAAGENMVTRVGRDYCMVTLQGVAGNQAQIDGACGDDLPDPVGLSAGNTILLDEGRIRAFVSRVEDTRARLAINGELVTVGLGRTAVVTVQDDPCGIKLDAVDRGHVQLSATCGALMTISPPVLTGATVALADGAARVFLSSVSDDGATARIAINGLDTHTVRAGQEIALDGDCAVVVESIARSSARFSHRCAD